MDYRDTYRDTFSTLLQTYVNYPLEVTIETTGKCNARCVFCPHAQMERRFTDMPDSLFLKIISDLKEIPTNHKFSISPFKVNEPLMDKNIFKKIEIINNELPNAGVRFFSNFNMATYEHIEKLSKIKNLQTLWISLNLINPEEYKEVMGLDLNKTLKNIEMLLKFNKEHKIVDKVSISRVCDGTYKDKEFVDKLNEILKEYRAEYEIKLLPRSGWIDYVDSLFDVPEQQPCLRWFEVNITCTGKVALCCMDGEAKYSIGDVNEQSVLEVYNKKEYRELRENIYPRKFLDPCKRCSL